MTRNEISPRVLEQIRKLDGAKLTEYGTRFAISLLLGRVRVFGGFSPFGVAFSAASPDGLRGLLSLLGLILGTLTAGSFGWAVKYIAAAVLVRAILHFFPEMGSRFFSMAVTFAVMAVIGAVFAWDTGWELMATTLYVVETFLAAGCVYFYDAALSPWQDSSSHRSVRALHSVSLTILAATLLMSLTDLELFGVLSIGRGLAVMAVMFLTFRGGIGPGCVGGAALGAAMDLASGTAPFFTMSYAFTALIAGLFSRDGRLPFLLSWIAANALSVLWTWGNFAMLPALYETFAASVLFMLLPDSLLSRLSFFLPSDASGYGFLKAREYTRDRVEQCAEAFRSLYDMVRSASHQVPEKSAEIYDRASDTVCRSCPMATRCWQLDYVDTLDIINHLTPLLQTRGSVSTEDLPERFLEKCDRAEGLIAAINAEARTFLLRRQYRARLHESRETACGQYNDISQILRALSEELGGEITVEPTLERRLRQYLRSLSIDASVAVFRVRGGRLRAEIRSQSLQLLRRDPAYLDKLSVALGARLCTSADPTDTDRLVLLEAEPIAVTVGVASAKKAGEAVSGDKCVTFRTEEGKLYVLLSDGMGSGSEAAKAASSVTGVLERLLRAGVKPELALRILSDLMLLKNEEELGTATVDMLSLDMFSGEAVFYKCGAAPSYLKKSNLVKRLGGGALPIGLHSSSLTARGKLTPGSFAVMVSDGIVSGDDKWLRELLTDYEGDDPRALAKHILEEAAKTSGSADDSTVIALKTEERK